MKCIKCKKTFDDVTKNKLCGKCLQEKLKKMKVHTSIEGTGIMTYWSCVGIQSFCKNYSRTYVIQEYPKLSDPVIFTVNDFIDFYESFPEDILHHLDNCLYAVTKYKKNNVEPKGGIV